MTRWLTALFCCLLIAPSALAETPPWATYTVTFDATWSETTHPQSFPGNAHFSGLIGGTHDASVAFWAEGALASTGIKQMAEWGSQPALAGEVEMAIGAGQAGEVISSDVLWVSPGQVGTSFTISPDFPLVTLTTMIAPSPDWFAGVAGLSLLQGQDWVTELVVPLYPYDAGTDSGVNYTSGDQTTVPADPIAAVVSGPFTPGVPVGTLTFRLDAAAAVALPVAPLALSSQPNPFNPATVLHYEIPVGAHEVQLRIFDARGRQVRRLSVGNGPGLQATGWDGRTDNGLRSASGVYFVRLDVDGVAAVHKVALVQ